MTRNEFIAEAAARFAAARIASQAARRGEERLSVGEAMGVADVLEAVKAAPWQSATALPDAARRVVDAAVAAYDDAHDMNVRGKLWDAVRAYKESVK